MLDENYDAARIEPRIAEKWERADAFAAGAGVADSARAKAEPYCIVIPPPNVTGSLHMGHALNDTLQDILIRFERMRGKDVLWQPGMDHAGIATQSVVERKLEEAGEPDRHALGREEFIDRVWKWKEESGGAILNQLKRLGASCDWSRERFTMDEGLSEAVVEVFVRLYEEGLIYKAKRLVNWDPRLLTAISDLEVEQIEVQGKLWHFRYPLADGASYDHPYRLGPDGERLEWRPSDEGQPDGYEKRDYLIVATTRPETMLGDTGVAVHPSDLRYGDLVGRHVVLPLVGRRIPVVADEYPDPEMGAGAVKMTPAHDFNDFEVGLRCDLPALNVMTREAKLFLLDNPEFLDGASERNRAHWEALDGLEREEARDLIVSLMEREGFLDGVEDHVHSVPHGDRSGVPIEPFLTDQWYVDAQAMAEPAIRSVRERKTFFVPQSWEDTFFSWMENIRPWCISRQLWWGHRIPAWYGPDGEIFVERDEEAAISEAIQHYCAAEHPWKAWVEERVDAARPSEILTRDDDVLDTWFSSALWPFSTLGWPDGTPELKRYYPGAVLVTGFDIIFFWVARMMMMGLHFTDSEPFRIVYVHALVRDKRGAKMSKSKGNVVDPLDLIDEYGADALRFSLAIMAAQGRDVKLDPDRVASYRNFATKLWNAARFCRMNEAAARKGFDPLGAELSLNRWILTELSEAVADVTDSLESFRFNDAASSAYRFVWHVWCDWHLELLKPVFDSGDEAAIRESRDCLGYVFEESLMLLHPFMPFVTEALWEEFGHEELLCHSRWPLPDLRDRDAKIEIDWLIELVSGIRSLRAEMDVKPSLTLPLVMVGSDERTRRRIDAHGSAICRLARMDSVTLSDETPPDSARFVIGESLACLPLSGTLDMDAEIKRLSAKVSGLDKEIDRLHKKLSNPRFVDEAPRETVEAEREKRAEYEAKRERTRKALEGLRASRSVVGAGSV